MSEPRFGAWTATADRLPDTAGLVIGEWPDGETGPVCYSEFPGWMDGDCPMNPPVRWMPMPRPGETAGPGEATMRILSTLDRKQAEAAKTTEEYTLTVWPSPWGNREITYETVTAALRECGMEDKP